MSSDMGGFPERGDIRHTTEMENPITLIGKGWAYADPISILGSGASETTQPPFFPGIQIMPDSSYDTGEFGGVDNNNISRSAIENSVAIYCRGKNWYDLNMGLILVGGNYAGKGLNHKASFDFDGRPPAITWAVPQVYASQRKSYARPQGRIFYNPTADTAGTLYLSTLISGFTNSLVSCLAVDAYKRVILGAGVDGVVTNSPFSDETLAIANTSGVYGSDGDAFIKFYGSRNYLSGGFYDYTDFQPPVFQFLNIHGGPSQVQFTRTGTIVGAIEWLASNGSSGTINTSRMSHTARMDVITEAEGSMSNMETISSAIRFWVGSGYGIDRGSISFASQYQDKALLERQMRLAMVMHHDGIVEVPGDMTVGEGGAYVSKDGHTHAQYLTAGGSSTDNAVSLWNGTTGKILKNSTLLYGQSSAGFLDWATTGAKGQNWYNNAGSLTRAFDSSGEGGGLQYYSDDTLYLDNFSPNKDLYIRGNSNNTAWNAIHIDTSEKNINFASGAATIIYDSTNNDYAKSSHDGTDFNTAFVGTTDWNISGHTGSVIITGNTSGTISLKDLGQITTDGALNTIGTGDRTSTGYHYIYRDNGISRLYDTAYGDYLQFDGATNNDAYFPAGRVRWPATQNASSDPNTNDDYEEGTWTGTIVGTSTNPTQSYGTQNCRYIKNGRMCYVNFDIRMAAAGISSGTGNAYIGSLPFTSSSYYSGGGSIADSANWGTGTTGAPNVLAVNSTSATAWMSRLTSIGGAGTTYASAADVTNSTRVIGGITYETAS